MPKPDLFDPRRGDIVIKYNDENEGIRLYFVRPKSFHYVVSGDFSTDNLTAYWIMVALDLELNEESQFAIDDIMEWNPPTTVDLKANDLTLKPMGAPKL